MGAERKGLEVVSASRNVLWKSQRCASIGKIQLSSFGGGVSGRSSVYLDAPDSFLALALALGGGFCQSGIYAF